jgi:ubiquitin-conjugating enzyme E2 D/E
MSTRRRLEREYTVLKASPPEGCWAQPDENNLFSWKATIEGPKGSPYEGGAFNLSIQYPEDYPYRPPEVKFLTKIYHPNVECDSGHIGLNILRQDWCPALTISVILVSVQAFLSDPDPSDGIVPEIAVEFETKKEQFEMTAREWTEKYAKREAETLGE